MEERRFPPLTRLSGQSRSQDANAAALGISETKRKVKVCSITKAGKKQLQVEGANWNGATALVAPFLEQSS